MPVGKQVQHVQLVGNQTSSTLSFQLPPNERFMSWEVSVVDASATTALQGRMSPDAPWFQLDSVALSAGVSTIRGNNSVPAAGILAMPEMRIVTTVAAGATVDVWLMA